MRHKTHKVGLSAFRPATAFAVPVLHRARVRCERHDAGHQVDAREPRGNRSTLRFMLRDLKTSRRKIEQAHQEWMAALDVVSDPIFLHDREYRILRCNKAYQQCAGMPFKQIIGQPYYEIFPKTDAPLPCCLWATEKTEEDVMVGEAIYRSRTLPIHDGRGAYLYSVRTLENITERRRAQNVLRNSEEQYRTMIENSNDMIWTLAPDGSFTFINQQAADVTGRSIGDWLGKTFEPLVVEEDLPMVLELHGRIMRGEKVHYEVRGKKACGGILTLLVNASPIFKDGKVNGTISFARDITEQKRVEAAIQHANRALATLSAVNRELVHATCENGLLQAICQAIVQQRGYRMAWVGYKQHDEGKSIRIMARAGHNEGYLDALQLSWAENERGMGPSGRAVRSGATQLCQDMVNDPRYRPWRDAALQHGFASSIALPLINGEVFGILNVYAAEVNAFSSSEIKLLEEMAGDLAFGVITLHTRQERDLALEQNRRHLEKLHGSLEDTVRAMAYLVEMRDPYTAGHQARVAELAAAIARQMGLPDEQVHGIHLAGTVHDLGKIRIPAEILSMPGRISDFELGLIKVHPQVGYDILKNIDFPWPIAQMVLQHHERLDGSGYPQGLKGDATLLEARILSVADVVEAMSSHRPYRPGFGIDAALGEITRQRGIHYDPQAVNACLALFREQNYSFKS